MWLGGGCIKYKVLMIYFMRACGSAAVAQVIDVLQKWNWNKRLERWSKTVLKGRFAKGVRDGMSAIEPATYRNRFLAGMSYQLGLESYTSDTHSV